MIAGDVAENEIAFIHDADTDAAKLRLFTDVNAGRVRILVMSGATSVRRAEDLEGGALNYAEIKAIASGNTAVMEKVKVDTEIHKLDQLGAVHLDQQHTVRWQIRTLPQQIAEGHQTVRCLHEDRTTRDANTGNGRQTSAGRLSRSSRAASVVRCCSHTTASRTVI